jgi:hypothetical protein
VQEDEGALVRNAKVAGERQRGLALYLVAEDRDGGEIAAERQFVAGEQRAAGDAEIRLAAPAAKAGSALEAAAIVSVKAAAVRANRRAIGFGPADLPKPGFRFLILHRENGRQRERLGRPGKEEMLCHLVPLLNKDIICDIQVVGNRNIRYDIFSEGGMNIKSEEEWAERAAAFLKHKLKETEVTYDELATRLKKHGLNETKASVANKLARGTFPATFFLACIAALELEGVALEEI